MDEQVTREPILLQRIDYDREGRLVLVLNQHVTNEWIRAFWGSRTSRVSRVKNLEIFHLKGIEPISTTTMKASNSSITLKII